MQFPNGVNKSNLIKLGVLGAAMYLLNNRNKSQASQPQVTDQVSQPSTDSDTRSDSQPTTPFQLGKALADKVFGRK